MAPGGPRCKHRRLHSCVLAPSPLRPWAFLEQLGVSAFLATSLRRSGGNCQRRTRPQLPALCPQTPTGGLDNVQGIRQFIVGTGGKNLQVPDSTGTNREAANGNKHGVLKRHCVPPPTAAVHPGGREDVHGLRHWLLPLRALRPGLRMEQEVIRFRDCPRGRDFSVPP
jgi:hypothetical protein